MFGSLVDTSLLAGKNYVLVNTPKKLHWLFGTLGTLSRCAFDVETNAPTRKGQAYPVGEIPRVIGVSFSWAKGTAAYLPLCENGRGDPFWKQPQVNQRVVEHLRNFLEDGAVPKTAQNGKFDCQELFKDPQLGIRVQGFDFDTMLAHHLLDEEGVMTCRHGLKPMAAYYLDPNAEKYEESLHKALDYYDPQLRRYSSVPLDITYPYACSDADFTLQLEHVFRPKLAAENLTWLFENMTMPLQFTCMLSEISGLCVDLDRVAELEVYYAQRQRELSDQIWGIVGDRFDIQSPAQVAEVLYQQLKLPEQRDKYGKITTSTKALERLAGKHDVIAPLKEIRGINIQKQTFVDGVRKRISPLTKRLHPSFWVHGTRTGRLASSDPNVQNWPTPAKGGVRVKGMVQAKPGAKLILSDYSQIELRTAAHLSQEQTWIEAFRRGDDLHSATAKSVFSLDCDVSLVKKLYEDKRTDAKKVNFGVLYGQGVHGLMRLLNITEEQAEAFIGKYFAGLPNLKIWMDGVVAFALEHGYVVNPFGRRRHVPDIRMQVPPRQRRPRNAPDCWGRKKEAPPILKILGSKFDAVENQGFFSNITQLHHLVGQLSDAPAYHECAVCPQIGSCTFAAEAGRREYVVAELKRQIINFLIQSTATADLAGMAYAKVVREARRHGIPLALSPEQKGFSPVNIVHDELIYMVDDEYVGQMTRLVKDVMMGMWPECSVALEVDQEIVQRWSDKHEKGKALHLEDFEVPEEWIAGVPDYDDEIDDALEEALAV